MKLQHKTLTALVISLMAVNVYGENALTDGLKPEERDLIKQAKQSSVQQTQNKITAEQNAAQNANNQSAKDLDYMPDAQTQKDAQDFVNTVIGDNTQKPDEKTELALRTQLAMIDLTPAEKKYTSYSTACQGGNTADYCSSPYNNSSKAAQSTVNPDSFKLKQVNGKWAMVPIRNKGDDSNAQLVKIGSFGGYDFYEWSDSKTVAVMQEKGLMPSQQANANTQGSGNTQQANNNDGKKDSTVKKVAVQAVTALATNLLGGKSNDNSFLSSNSCDKPSGLVGGYLAQWDFCWDSVFPWRIAGNDTIESSNDEVGSPYGAHTKTWCKCGEEPFAYYGIPTGYWEPTRIVEVVRHQECTVTQGLKAEAQLIILNNTLGKVVRRVSGNEGDIPIDVRRKVNKIHDKMGGGNNFRHFHSWPVPSEISTIYSAFRTSCANMAENDRLETSIANFAWNASGHNPMFGKTRLLMNIYYPEYFFLLDPLEGLSESLSSVTNTVNTVLRPLSCAANTTGVGLRADDMGYWLGGCFEDNLPTSGQTTANNTLSATHTALEKSIFLSARTGGYASKNTVGNNALCSPTPVGIAPKKSHYKFTMLYPYKEGEESDGDDDQGNKQETNKIMGKNKGMIGGVMSLVGSGGEGGIKDMIVGKVMDWVGVENTKCAHRFGASKSQWGAKRHAQGDPNSSYEQITSKNDNDAAYMVWRWVDCCWP